MIRRLGFGFRPCDNGDKHSKRPELETLQTLWESKGIHRRYAAPICRTDPHKIHNLGEVLSDEDDKHLDL
jgi:hypothetical protein